MALSTNTPRDRRNSQVAMYDSLVVKTGKVIYSGAIVTKIRATTGNPCEPATNDAAANVFAGIATGGGDIGVSGNGTRAVELLTFGEVRLVAETTITKAIVGTTLVYAKDDGSVGTATTLGPPVGIVTKLDTVNDAGFCWVLLRATVPTTQT